MNYKRRIKITTPTDEELTEQYGGHKRAEINDCFVNKNKKEHYYCQKENFVLHVKDGEIINKLHNSSLDDININENFIKIDFKAFETVLLNTIFELGIYENTKNK